jgi:anti-sigma regulatory factor (Ser/Thr protein kinase)
MARRATLTFEQDRTTVRVARAFATRLIDLMPLEERTFDRSDEQALALMVSELVSNAVEHGVGPVRLTLGCRGPLLRVEIADRGEDVPVRRYSMPGALSGRGLEIVEQLAAGWGWEPLAEGGKLVWFEY